MMQAIHPKGGVGNDPESFQHDVLSNALLPDMFCGRGVRLFPAPSDDGMLLMILHLSVLCPGA